MVCNLGRLGYKSLSTFYIRFRKSYTSVTQKQRVDCSPIRMNSLAVMFSERLRGHTLTLDARLFLHGRKRTALQNIKLSSVQEMLCTYQNVVQGIIRVNSPDNALLAPGEYKGICCSLPVQGVGYIMSNYKAALFKNRLSFKHAYNGKRKGRGIVRSAPSPFLGSRHEKPEPCQLTDRVCVYLSNKDFHGGPLAVSRRKYPRIGFSSSGSIEPDKKRYSV